jgi:hypothetical protein
MVFSGIPKTTPAELDTPALIPKTSPTASAVIRDGADFTNRVVCSTDLRGYEAKTLKKHNATVTNNSGKNSRVIPINFERNRGKRQ